MNESYIKTMIRHTIHGSHIAELIKRTYVKEVIIVGEFIYFYLQVLYIIIHVVSYLHFFPI